MRVDPKFITRKIEGMFAVLDIDRKRAVQYWSRAEDAEADARKRNFDEECFQNEKALKMTREGL